MSRILILTSSYPRWKGDFAGNFVHNLSQYLSMQGHRVYVLAPHAKGLSLQETIDGVYITRFKYFWPDKMEKLCYNQGIPSNIQTGILPRIQLLFYTFSQLITTWLSVRKYHIDVINSHWVAPQGFIGSIASRFFGVRHVLTAHSAAIQTISRWKYIAGPMIRFILKGTDYAFTVSYYNRELMKQFAKSAPKMEVLPMGVDTELFSPDDIGNQRHYEFIKEMKLLFVGRLIYLKGVHVLLNALVKFPDLRKQISLNIVGDGPERRKLQAFCQNHDLRKVFFFGTITNTQEIVRYYRSSYAVVIPSIFEREGRTEGLPVVALEALSCGKPLICSKIGGITDIVRDNENGFLFKPGDIESLRHSLTRLLKLKPKDYFRLSKSARDTALNYDWRVIGKRYHSVIEDLCQSES